MEIITSFFTTLWTALNNENMLIPIVNITVGRFLLGVFVVNIVVSLIMMFLGHSVSDKGMNDKISIRR